jgi:hypothetical protein
MFLTGPALARVGEMGYQQARNVVEGFVHCHFVVVE